VGWGRHCPLLFCVEVVQKSFEAQEKRGSLWNKVYLSFPSCFSSSRNPLHLSRTFITQIYGAASKIAESADMEDALPPAPLILEALEVSRSR